MVMYSICDVKAFTRLVTEFVKYFDVAVRADKHRYGRHNACSSQHMFSL